jgi:hypothetical protein
LGKYGSVFMEGDRKDIGHYSMHICEPIFRMMNLYESFRWQYVGNTDVSRLELFIKEYETL